MPKKRPSTLKLTFIEKGEGHYTWAGKPVRYVAAIQLLLERFFSKPLSQRLAELSDKVEKTDADLAQKVRIIKGQIEQREEYQRRAKEGGGFRTLGEIDFLPHGVDFTTESNFINSIEGMLNYLMVEAVYIAKVLPLDEATMQAAGLSETPKNRREILSRLRACLRDNYVSDFLGVQQGGNKKPTLSPEEIAALAEEYEELASELKLVKKEHDRSHAAYQDSPKVRREGYKHERWVRAWVAEAKQRYDLPDHVLEQIAGQGATVSGIACQEMARKWGTSASYMVKLVAKSRKLRRMNRTFKMQS